MVGDIHSISHSMSDKTFKQQVEEIQSKQSCNETFCLLGVCGVGVVTLCSRCRTDRILAAHNAELGRIAEGMPLTKETAEDFSFKTKAEAYLSGKVLQQADAKAYIQAQKEGM